MPIAQVPSKIGPLMRGNSGTLDHTNTIQNDALAAVNPVNSTTASPIISKVVQPTATVSSIPVSAPSELTRNS